MSQRTSRTSGAARRARGTSPTGALRRARAQIEKTDDAILALIVKRVGLARRIGHAKAAAGLPILDPSREAAVVRRAAAQARVLRLPVEDVRALFWAIIAMCRGEQAAHPRSARRTPRSP